MPGRSDRSAGSGKSTSAAEHLGPSVVSSDALRSLVGEGEDDLRASADACAVIDDIVERRLRRGLRTVLDSLGTGPRRRAKWRAIAAARDVPCVAVVFDVPSAQLRRQNRSRRVQSIAQRAENSGMDGLWVMDHFRQIPKMGPPWSDRMESWTTLAHLAACTTMRFGVLAS